MECDRSIRSHPTAALVGSSWRESASRVDAKDAGIIENSPENLHPLQEAFREAHGLQCGFCTPGFLMTLVPFLEENPDPDERQIREALSGNICRCTGYQHIVDAVLIAAENAKK